MKKTIYIHVGFGKTGTSAIQKVFFQNREQLKSIGCLYPITGEIFTAHYNLSVLGEEEMDTKTINLYEKLLVEIKNSNCNIIVLSSEQFIFLKELYVKQISEFLKDFDVKIIFYIREQIKLIESTYLQWLKAGSKPFYKNIYEFYSQHKDSFNFNQRIKYFEKHFSQSEIIVRLFDKRIIGNDVSKDFISLLKLQDDTILYNNSYENESIIPEFTEIVQFIHGSDKDNQIKRELIKELVDISGKLKNISQLELIDSEFKIEVLRYFYNENLEFAHKYLFANEKNLFLELINDNR